MAVKCCCSSAFLPFCSCFFFVPSLVCPVDVTILLYAQRKQQKSLEDIVKTLNFAASKHEF